MLLIKKFIADYGVLKMLLRGQQMIKFKVRTIEEKQDTIIKMLEDIQNKASSYSQDNNIDYYPISDLFPLKNLEDLYQIEEQILMDIDFRSKIVCIITQFVPKLSNLHKIIYYFCRFVNFLT